MIESGANSNNGNGGSGNVGGAENEFHRVRFTLPEWQSLDDGATWDMTLNYYLPVSGPQAYTATINGSTYALAFEHPELPLADLSSGGEGGEDGSECGSTNGIPTYPEWPQGDHASGGNQIIYEGEVYEAKWWTNSVPGSDGSWEFVCSVN